MPKELLFLSIGVFFALTGIWLLTSLPDYDAAAAVSRKNTAGWFILGLPLILPVCFGVAGIFLLLRRKTSRDLAWMVMISVGIGTVILCCFHSTPEVHLRRIIGEKASENCRLLMLRSMDSFNDGIFSVGIITGNDQVLSMIASEYGASIDPSVSGSVNITWLKNVKLPEFVPGIVTPHGSFRLDKAAGKIYFQYRDLLPPKK